MIYVCTYIHTKWGNITRTCKFLNERKYNRLTDYQYCSLPSLIRLSTKLNVPWKYKLQLIPSCSGHILNDFTWTHCASGRFNTAWFIYTLLLIGLIFLTNKRKRISNPVACRCTPFPGKAKRWACELEPGVLVQLELTTECHLKFFYLLY